MHRPIDETKAMMTRLQEIMKSYEALEHAPEEYNGYIAAKRNLAILEDELRAAIAANTPLDELETLCTAWADGRVVVLPKPEINPYEGLKGKYHVFKARDNTPVENCFVLRPDKDQAAVSALTAYAKATDNKQLADDILRWITPDEKVVVLPCKVGGVICNDDCGYDWMLEDVGVLARCNEDIEWYTLDELTKTVDTITREAAAAALQEGQ